MTFIFQADSSFFFCIARLICPLLGTKPREKTGSASLSTAGVMQTCATAMPLDGLSECGNILAPHLGWRLNHVAKQFYSSKLLPTRTSQNANMHPARAHAGVKSSVTARPPAPSTRAPHSTHRASGSVLSQPQHNTHNNNHRKRCAPEVKLTEGPVSVLCQLLLCRYKRETESQSRRTNEIIRQKCVNLKNQQLLGAARH